MSSIRCVDFRRMLFGYEEEIVQRKKLNYFFEPTNYLFHLCLFKKKMACSSCFNLRLLRSLGFYRDKVQTMRLDLR